MCIRRNEHPDTVNIDAIDAFMKMRPPRISWIQLSGGMVWNTADDRNLVAARDPPPSEFEAPRCGSTDFRWKVLTEKKYVHWLHERYQCYIMHSYLLNLQQFVFAIKVTARFDG